jgi:large subunit ribosomal protein L4
MAEVKLLQGGVVSTTEVDASVFGTRVLGRTLKAAVVMYEANARAGTHKTKTRGEVNGPNRKLWPQKHTGLERMGTVM